MFMFQGVLNFVQTAFLYIHFNESSIYNFRIKINQVKQIKKIFCPSHDHSLLLRQPRHQPESQNQYTELSQMNMNQSVRRERGQVKGHMSKSQSVFIEVGQLNMNLWGHKELGQMNMNQ